ncbi:beta-1,3-galactosyltransferase 4-like [Vipera latastei]
MPPRLKLYPRRMLRLLWALMATLLVLTFLATGGCKKLILSAVPLLLPLLPLPAARDAPVVPLPPTEFLLSPLPCTMPAPWLLVLVASAPGHVARRTAVRRSWGAVQLVGNRELRILFVLGLPAEAELQVVLEREAAEHRDLLQGRFIDTYTNLTLKTLALMDWAAAHCPTARFLLKADDDVFLNVPGLVRELEHLGGPPEATTYLGYVHWPVMPTHDPHGHHYVPDSVYPYAIYPPYCGGSTYVLSAPAVATVLDAARHLPLVPVEDAFVGICARHAAIAPRHLARLAGSTYYPPDTCCYREVLLSVHHVMPTQMLAVAMAPAPLCTCWQHLLGLARCNVLAWLAWVAKE